MHHSVILLSVLSVLNASPLFAQSGSDRISRPPDNATAPTQPSQTGTGALTFTNQAGKAYTMTELTSRLQELRTAVDQSLPLLSAFNENFSNTVSSQPGGLAGAISGILSGARGSGSAQDQNGSSSRSPALTNIVGVLRGLLGSNTPASTSTAGQVNTNTVHDLLALEGELQPVASVLRSLNLNPSGVSDPQRSGQPTAPGSTRNDIPTPTGRQ